MVLGPLPGGANLHVDHITQAHVSTITELKFLENGAPIICDHCNLSLLVPFSTWLPEKSPRMVASLM